MKGCEFLQDMTKIIVSESENETMLAGEELAKEILEIDKDRSIVIFLEVN